MATRNEIMQSIRQKNKQKVALKKAIRLLQIRGVTDISAELTDQELETIDSDLDSKISVLQSEKTILES